MWCHANRDRVVTWCESQLHPVTSEAQKPTKDWHESDMSQFATSTGSWMSRYPRTMAFDYLTLFNLLRQPWRSQWLIALRALNHKYLRPPRWLSESPATCVDEYDGSSGLEDGLGNVMRLLTLWCDDSWVLTCLWWGSVHVKIYYFRGSACLTLTASVYKIGCQYALVGTSPSDIRSRD